ncbi:WGR domain-containing protein [Beijerinckia mobilis]|uniref:WGR domain-containing protein n=1 Tax=Beijerinckia mobilis TaxID=231434 RepID=UPI00068F03C3|nr:WGR domain-containing protein [Beijerinckia mobilis]
MDELAILLEARAPELNRMRFWRVRVGRDLFGSWNARVTFGRIGGAGRTMRSDFEDRDEARAFVRKGLKRRKGAQRRCGATYQLVEASGEAGDLLSQEAGAPARPMSARRPIQQASGPKSGALPPASVPALPPTFWDWLEARRESGS